MGQSSCACFSINWKDCLCKRCVGVCRKGYYAGVYQTYQTTGHDWILAHSSESLCSAACTSVQLFQTCYYPFLIQCMNPFAKSRIACCNCVLLCVSSYWYDSLYVSLLTLYTALSEALGHFWTEIPVPIVDEKIFFFVTLKNVSFLPPSAFLLFRGDKGIIKVVRIWISFSTHLAWLVKDHKRDAV